MQEKWIDQTKRYEGLRLKPYTCPTGHLTIGYGHNLENGITQDMAEYILTRDMALAQMEVGARVPWAGQLDEARQYVLVDMAFNMGISKLMTFKKFLAALNKRDYPAAAKEMLDSRWATQTGRRAKELAEIMKTGAYND